MTSAERESADIEAYAQDSRRPVQDSQSPRVAVLRQFAIPHWLSPLAGFQLFVQNHHPGQIVRVFVQSPRNAGRGRAMASLSGK